MLKNFYVSLVIIFLFSSTVFSKPLPHQNPVIATFSIVAYDSVAEEWGVAV